MLRTIILELSVLLVTSLVRFQYSGLSAQLELLAPNMLNGEHPNNTVLGFTDG